MISRKVYDELEERLFDGSGRIKQMKSVIEACSDCRDKYYPSFCCQSCKHSSFKIGGREVIDDGYVNLLFICCKCEKSYFVQAAGDRVLIFMKPSELFPPEEKK